jgi:hypothetical protein
MRGRRADSVSRSETIEAEKARNAEYTEKRDKLTKIIASLGG